MRRRSSPVPLTPTHRRTWRRWWRYCHCGLAVALPRRPLWLCRRCAAPWPCGQAKLDLLRELGADPAYLRVFLASQMHMALRDLYALDPHGLPGPAELWARFLAWTTTGDSHPR